MVKLLYSAIPLDWKKFFSYTICLLLFISFISGCASSAVERTAAQNLDMGFNNVSNMVGNAENSSIADSYGNSTQRFKGALFGGALGLAAGAMYSGLGMVPGTAIGAVLGASYGTYVDTTMSLSDQLINRGVNTIILGDNVLLVVPSARLFGPMTASIRQTAFSTLYLITCYLNQFTNIMVKVSAYTAASGDSSVDYELSRLQAESVLKYLIDSGLNTRLIYAAGKGCTKVVTNNAAGWDSDNYRIEISLEKQAVCC